MKRSPSLNAKASRRKSSGGHQHHHKQTNKPITSGFIATPTLDFWLTGGVSVIIMAILLLTYWSNGDQDSSISTAISHAIVLQALVNWPHFMGAYGLLYQPISNLKKYPFSTLYVPILLLLCLVWSWISGPRELGLWSVNQDLAYGIWLVAAFYLAWHYTGQAWGMMATFSRLSGLTLTPWQRIVLRVGLRLLLVWHVVWGAQDLPPTWLGGMSAYIPLLLQIMTTLCVIAFLCGVGIWWLIRQQTGRWPDNRILIAWLAIYMWYWVLLLMPAAYIWVQFSHALQYLAFPIRMQVNKAVVKQQASGASIKTASFSWQSGTKYYALLLVSGLVVFYLPMEFFSSTQQYGLPVLLASMVSIHHYFVDGCIWKISHPEVRRALFWHLPTQKSS